MRVCCVCCQALPVGVAAPVGMPVPAPRPHPVREPAAAGVPATPSPSMASGSGAGGSAGADAGPVVKRADVMNALVTLGLSQHKDAVARALVSMRTVPSTQLVQLLISAGVPAGSATDLDDYLADGSIPVCNRGCRSFGGLACALAEVPFAYRVLCACVMCRLCLRHPPRHLPRGLRSYLAPRPCLRLCLPDPPLQGPPWFVLSFTHV